MRSDEEAACIMVEWMLDRNSVSLLFPTRRRDLLKLFQLAFNDR